MEAFFGLTGRPFAAAPRIDRYYPARAIESARTTLIRAVERAEGPGAAIGPSGCGKTLLCRLLADHFKGALRVAAVAGARIDSRRALWQSLLYELNLPYRGMDDGELRLALHGHLTSADIAKPTLILADEAHLLSLKLLDELRTLADLLRDCQPAVRLVLFGGPSLEERFAHPRMESFAQRLCARCYLEPLGRDDVHGFIAAQVEACEGETSGLFLDDAADAVQRVSDGVPRLINQVCDHALVLAFAEGLSQISGSLIEQAWADLQQLPAPRSLEDDPQSRSASIEYGRLDEADEEPIASFPFPGARRAAWEDAEEAAEAGASGPELGPISAEGFGSNSHDALYAESAAAADFAPPADSEVEMSVSKSEVDPFAENFEEDVALADPYAKLARPTPTPRPTTPPLPARPEPRVTDWPLAPSPTASPLAASGASAVREPDGAFHDNYAPAASPAALSGGSQAAMSPAEQAPLVAAEMLPFAAHRAVKAAPPSTPQSTGSASGGKTAAKTAAKRGEFKQLFTRLRQKSGA